MDDAALPAMEVVPTRLTQINEWSQEVYVDSILPDGTELGRVRSERSEQSVSVGSAG